MAPACVIESRNVNVGQVPRSSVPFANTAPSNGVVALNVGASSLPTVTNARSTDRASGAEVPDTQGRGELIFRPRPNFYIGGVFERGFGHQVVDESLPAARRGNVTGVGMIVGGTLSPEPGSRFSFGVTATLMHWTVPYDQYTTATVDVAGLVTGVSQFTTSDSDTTGTIGLGFWPSYTFGELRLFGGGFVTQKPTVALFTRDTTVISPVIASEGDDVVGNDAIDLVLAAGLEYSITRELALTAIINQEVLGATMRTGPSLQLAASIRLGSHPSDRRRQDLPATFVVPPPPATSPPPPATPAPPPPFQ